MSGASEVPAIPEDVRAMTETLYEVANQLGGSIDTRTPEADVKWLLKLEAMIVGVAEQLPALVAARPVDTGREKALEEIAAKLNMDADLETERVEKKRIGSIGRTSGLWAALKLRIAANEVRALANPENGRG